MSKEDGKDRTDGEREAVVRQDGAGHEEPRPERPLSMKGSAEVLGKHGGPAITQPQHHKPPKPAAKAARPRPAKSQPNASGPGKGRPTPKQDPKRARKQSRPATRGRSRPGRPDGPLARRRRLRIRLLAALWLIVNVAAWAVWRDWQVSLAVFVLSVLITPLLGALLLRRR